MTFLQSSWGLGSGYGFGLAIAIARATAGMLKVGNILLQWKCCRWQIHEMSFQRFFATAMCKTKKIPKKLKNTKKTKKYQKNKNCLRQDPPVGGGRILVFFVILVFLFFCIFFVFFCFLFFWLFCYFWLIDYWFIYLLSSLYICLYNTVLYHVLCKMYWNIFYIVFSL